MAGRRGKEDGPGKSPDNDLELWRRVSRTAKPLPGRAQRHRDGGSDTGETPRPAADKPAKAPAPRRPAPKPPEPKPLPELAPGAAADVDKRTADRLKRGKLPISARLDLHGRTQGEALALLNGFLADSQAAGRRCVLVITGKGPGLEGGVLRRMLPQWLNLPANRGRVVAFAAAQPEHGGHGAFYVLLKRRRA